jgi:NADH dehydrogenase [ubiquinone] 1 alpha subcomplex assembly factor 7
MGNGVVAADGSGRRVVVVAVADNVTALADIIAKMIAEEGPMPLDRYMALCLGHPVHGYYMTRDPFGADGDFTTAPEISQVFGELLGVWVAQAWAAIGSPSKFALVELGPGRGTLMADMLRVLGKVEKCRKAARVQFVEMSPVLRVAQQEKVPDATWHDSVASLPALPTILVANEFFDALPIRQLERKDGRMFERCIVATDAGLKLTLLPSPTRLLQGGDGVIEDSTLRNTIATHLGDHLKTVGGAGLIVDYGHVRSAIGDTLQALRNHKFCSITDDPGEADVTSHVDFEALGKAVVKGGAEILGVMTQGAFLEAMGLSARTEVLANSVSGDTKHNLIKAAERLAHDDQMGQLFKVMAIAGSAQTSIYPFGAA